MIRGVLVTRYLYRQIVDCPEQNLQILFGRSHRPTAMLECGRIKRPGWYVANRARIERGVVVPVNASYQTPVSRQCFRGGFLEPVGSPTKNELPGRERPGRAAVTNSRSDCSESQRIDGRVLNAVALNSRMRSQRGGSGLEPVFRATTRYLIREQRPASRSTSDMTKNRSLVSFAAVRIA